MMMGGKTDLGARKPDGRAALMPARLASSCFSLYPRAPASQNSSTPISLDEEKTP
jgi:hypothetical protein